MGRRVNGWALNLCHFLFCEDFTPAVAAGVVDGTSATTAPAINAMHKHAIATRAIVSFFSFFVVVVVVGCVAGWLGVAKIMV